MELCEVYDLRKESCGHCLGLDMKWDEEGSVSWQV